MYPKTELMGTVGVRWSQVGRRNSGTPGPVLSGSLRLSLRFRSLRPRGRDMDRIRK